MHFMFSTPSEYSLRGGVVDIIIQVYVDADMAGDKESRRSTTGYVFIVGGTIVS